MNVEIVTHGPCPNPKCNSTDAYSVNPKTLWGKCFSCGINIPPEGDKEIEHEHKEIQPAKKKKSEERPLTPLPEIYHALPDRGISKAAAEKYKIFRIGDRTYFPHFKDGKHVANKVRYGEKEFSWEGCKEGIGLFGQHLFPMGSAKGVTVVEGEYDAPAGFELLGSKFPVVSVSDGAGAAHRDCKEAFEWLNSFGEIVFCFDNDEPGRAASKSVAGMFSPGKIRIFTPRSHKDANEYLLKRDHGLFTKEWWQAPRFLPDGLKIGTDIWDEIVNRPNHFTTLWPFEGINKLTYGIRLSEMTVVTADTKVGKTTFLKELEHKLLIDPEIIEKGYGVGFMHFEEPNYDTGLGLMSIHNNKPYHLPDTVRNIDELRLAFDAVINNERVVIWDHFGSNAIQAVLDKVRHMAALGCKYIVIDHLSIIVSDQSGDERKQLDEISTKLKTLCMELNIALICVIHQNRAGQIRGTAGVEQLANIVIKLKRDKLDPDPWRRNVTEVIVQENRFCGRTGPACYLWYNEMTGRMMECDEQDVERFVNGERQRDDERPW